MKDPALEDRLNKILHRLAAVADRPERELRYKIVLVDVPMINALTLPGGTILVFRGLVDMVKNKMGDTDDAYASVLGHECAHAALRHGMGMIQVASSMGARGQGVHGRRERSVLAAHDHLARARVRGRSVRRALRLSRRLQSRRESVTLHETMLQAMGEIPRGMTHPTHAERIARVRDYLLDLRAKVRGFDLAVKALGDGDYDAARSALRGLPRRLPRLVVGALEPRRGAASQGALGARAVDALPPHHRRRSRTRARARSSCAPARSTSAASSRRRRSTSACSRRRWASIRRRCRSIPTTSSRRSTSARRSTT